LKDSEEPSRAGDSGGYKAKLAQQALPVAEGAAVVGETLVDGLEDSVVTMSGEAQGLVDAVDEPPEDGLHGVPGSVTISQFLDGKRFLGLVVFGRRFEVIVHGMQEQPAEGTQPVGGALAKGNKVINKNVNLLQGTSPRGEGGFQGRSRQWLEEVVGEVAPLLRRRGWTGGGLRRGFRPRSVGRSGHTIVRCCQVLQPMGRGVPAVKTRVYVVRNGLRERAEGGRRVAPAHGEDQGNGDQRRQPLEEGEHNGELGTMRGSQVHAVEAILDIKFGLVHGAKLGI
jgi:hypothetical protein